MPFFAYFIENPHPFLWKWGSLGGNEWGIRYYSLAYLTGFLVLFVGLRWQAKRGWSVLRGDAISDYVVWVAMAGVILGGRLGSCLLYSPRETFLHPLSIFTVWKGGMASHGGILGVILVMIFYARATKIPFYNLADATALFTPVTLGLGRCANFLNGELWGRPTDAWWGVVFPGAPYVEGFNVPRYPSQLIEALLEGLLLQVILIAVRLSTKREGAVALTFMAGYAILRIIGEQFREPDADIGFWFNTITQGQLLSGLMLLATALLAWRQFSSPPQGPFGVKFRNDLHDLMSAPHFDPADYLNLKETDHAAIFHGVTQAWEILPKLVHYLEEQIVPANFGRPIGSPVIGKHVYIGKNTVVEPGAYIKGPAWIGANCQIRHGAYIRENVIIGAGSVIGNSTEIKNSFLFNGVHAPHFNYIGDSVVGAKAHLAAGVIVSNLKLSGDFIMIRAGDAILTTGLRKFGALIGDEVEVGCNAVLNPGSVLGRRSLIYPGVSWRGVLPANSIAKTATEIHDRQG